MKKTTQDQFYRKSPDQIRREKLELKLQSVKDDQEPAVIKYYMKSKNSEQLYSPVHNVQYTICKRKPQITLANVLQKVQVEPQVEVDEIQESKWQVLSRNCLDLLEISRQTLGKPNEAQFLRNTSQEQNGRTPLGAKRKFFSKRQSIELRLGDITSPVSPSPPKTVPQQHQIKDPLIAKFQKFYRKIGIQSKESQKMNIQVGEERKTSPLEKRQQPLRKHSSLHISPVSSTYSHQFGQNKKARNSQYLQELLKLSSVAYNFQVKMKKDQSSDMMKVSQKVNDIQSEFYKFHQLLNEQDSSDNIKVN